MGLLHRLFRAPQIKEFHSSPIPEQDVSGNTLVPGGKAFQQTHTPGGTTTPVTVPVDVPGPKPGVNLHTGEWMNAGRVSSPTDTLQPRIGVQEPRGMPGNQAFYLNAPSAPATVKTIGARVPIVAKAPTQVRMKSAGSNSAETYAGSTVWDGASQGIVRDYAAFTPSQEYFNQGKALPHNEVYVQAHHVEVPRAHYQYGWTQAFIPEQGMRLSAIGDAPPLHQSRPIHINTVQSELMPLRAGKASRSPSRHKSLSQ